MTLFDFEELTAYWVEHPPVHILVGAYLGVSKRELRRSPLAGPGPGRMGWPDLPGILAELGPGFGMGDVHAGMPKVVLDFAELRSRARSEN